MAEDEDLEVLASVVLALLATADEETDEGADDEVEEGQHRPIVPGRSERESGFPTPTASGTWRLEHAGDVRTRRRTIRLPVALGFVNSRSSVQIRVSAPADHQLGSRPRGPASWLFRASGSPRARALRTIVEESLLEVMYDIPDRTEIRKCIITEETIRDGRPPLLLTKTEVDGGVDETNYAEWLATRGATA